MDEKQVDAALAALNESELRALAKGALRLTAQLIQHHTDLNTFLHQTAAAFNKAGEVFGKSFEPIAADVVALTERLLHKSN